MKSPTGGKLIVFQSTLPNHLDGALKQRDDPKIYNTSKESQALHPSTDFYKITSVEHSRSQIGIDLFLFGGQYLDVATLGCLSKHSGGSIYYYPNFTAQRREDVIKFKTELVELLTRPLGLEAVLRVRASKGIIFITFPDT